MNAKSILFIIVLAIPVFGQKGLAGTLWDLQKLNHSTDDIPRYSLQFLTDTTARTGMELNGCYYNYTVFESAASFKNRRCTALVLYGREGEFEAAMDSVSRYVVDKQRLFLMSASDTLMEYLNASTQGITEKIWQLQSIRQLSGATTITATDGCTAFFDTNGSSTIMADCNTCTGTFAITNVQDYIAGSLSVSSLSCTKIQCGAESKGGLFTTILGNVMEFGISNNKLYCFANTDTLVFNQETSDLRHDAFHPAQGRTENRYAVLVARNSIAITGLDRNAAGAGLFDLRGACMRRGIANDGSLILDVKGLSRGIYLLQVSLSQRESVTCRVHLAK